MAKQIHEHIANDDHFTTLAGRIENDIADQFREICRQNERTVSAELRLRIREIVKNECKPARKAS